MIAYLVVFLWMEGVILYGGGEKNFKKSIYAIKMSKTNSSLFFLWEMVFKDILILGVTLP